MDARRSKYRWLIGFIALIVLFVQGCSLLPKEEVEEVPVLLKPPESRLVTYEVREGYIAEVIRSTGRVAAVNEASLYFTRTDRLKKLYVETGDEVKKGQILAELETGDLRYRLERAKLDLQQEELRWQKISNLIGIEVNEVDAQIAKLNLEKAKLEVQHLSEQLENSVLRAPFDGVIVSVNQRERDLVEGYETVLRMADPSELEIRVELSYNTDRNKLVRGQKVQINIDRDQWVEGYIYQIGSTNDDPSLARNQYTLDQPVVKIRPTDPNTELEFDSLVRVVIVVQEEPNALLVPNAAIRRYMGRTYVRVLDGDVRKEVDVVTGIEGETETQIIKGLKKGDIVIAK